MQSFSLVCCQPEENAGTRKPGEEKTWRTEFSHQYYRQSVEGYTAASHTALHASFGAAAIWSKSLCECGKAFGGKFCVLSWIQPLLLFESKGLGEHESSTLSSSVYMASSWKSNDFLSNNCLILRTFSAEEERLRLHIEHVNVRRAIFLSIYGISFTPEIWQIYV